MSSPVSRIGDIGVGICYGHISPTAYVTVISSGAATDNANGSPVGIVGSIGIMTCGHISVALIGSSTVFANGSPVHRVGDLGESSAGGSYVVVTGSMNVNSG